MTFSEVVTRLCRRLKYPRPETLAFTHELVKELVQCLEEGNEVKIRGLGTFYWQEVQGREGSVCGREYRTERGWKLKFKPSTKLRGKQCQTTE